MLRLCLPRKYWWCFCRLALSWALRAVVWLIVARPLALLLFHLFQPGAWLLILTCAPLFPCTSATVCAAAQGASLGSWLWRKMLQQDDTEGVVTGWEQASWYRLGEGEGLLTLLILLTSISCSLVMMGSAPKSKVFEKNRLDQTIFWKYERHLCSIGQSKCSLLVTCRSGLLKSHFSFYLW